MTLIKKLVLSGALVACVTGAAIAAHDWYDRRYAWPLAIQKYVIGENASDGATLIEYEGFSAFDQGAFTWRYASTDNAALRKLCGHDPVKNCHFVRSRFLTSNVLRMVSYERGILVVQEVWS